MCFVAVEWGRSRSGGTGAWPVAGRPRTFAAGRSRGRRPRGVVTRKLQRRREFLLASRADQKLATRAQPDAHAAIAPGRVRPALAEAVAHAPAAVLEQRPVLDRAGRLDVVERDSPMGERRHGEVERLAVDAGVDAERGEEPRQEHSGDREHVVSAAPPLAQLSQREQEAN